MELEVLRPFGPSIAKLKIPNEIMIEMNNYTDDIINDKNKSSNLNHGNKLVGNVHQELLLDIEFMKKIKWAEFLAHACKEWVEKDDSRKKMSKFEIIKSWIVRQFKHEYNPVHWHSGHISGVGYLKVPKNLGSTVQKDKNINANGKLELIDGSKRLFTKPVYTVTPKEGDFYLFPNYMMHAVYPFSDTDEERRSVSFNAKIDDLTASI